MATEAEVIEKLTAVTQVLTEVGAGVTKIGTETDTLLVKIQELQDQINNSSGIPQSVLDAANAVLDQANVVKASVTSVDDKVPDQA